MKMNFTEQFPTLDSYIEYDYCRHGSRDIPSPATKAQLREFAAEHNIFFSKDKITKSELFHIIKEQIGTDALIAKFGLTGISGYDWQEKFNLSSAELRKLAKKGVIRVTDKYEIKGSYGRYNVNVYDAVQFYKYTADELTVFLQQKKKQQK